MLSYVFFNFEKLPYCFTCSPLVFNIFLVLLAPFLLEIFCVNLHMLTCCESFHPPYTNHVTYWIWLTSSVKPIAAACVCLYSAQMRCSWFFRSHFMYLEVSKLDRHFYMSCAFLWFFDPLNLSFSHLFCESVLEMKYNTDELDHNNSMCLDKVLCKQLLPLRQIFCILQWLKFSE